MWISKKNIQENLKCYYFHDHSVVMTVGAAGGLLQFPKVPI